MIKIDKLPPMIKVSLVNNLSKIEYDAYELTPSILESDKNDSTVLFDAKTVLKMVKESQDIQLKFGSNGLLFGRDIDNNSIEYNPVAVFADIDEIDYLLLYNIPLYDEIFDKKSKDFSINDILSSIEKELSSRKSKAKPTYKNFNSAWNEINSDANEPDFMLELALICSGNSENDELPLGWESSCKNILGHICNIDNVIELTFKNALIDKEKEEPKKKEELKKKEEPSFKNQVEEVVALKKKEEIKMYGFKYFTPAFVENYFKNVTNSNYLFHNRNNLNDSFSPGILENKEFLEEANIILLMFSFLMSIKSNYVFYNKEYKSVTAANNFYDFDYKIIIPDSLKIKD